MLLFWLARAMTNRQIRWIASSFYLPTGLFIVFSLLSLTYAHNVYEGLTLWIHWTCCAVFLFLTANETQEDEVAERLAKALFFSGFLTAVIGIIQHLFQFQGIIQVVPPAATFANKNMAAQHIVLTLPLAIGLFFTSRHPIRTWASAIAAGLMIVYLIYTRTRAAWVAFAAETAIFFLFIIRNRGFHLDAVSAKRTKYGAAGLGLLVIIVMINIGPDGFKWGAGEILDRIVSIGHREAASLKVNSAPQSTQTASKRRPPSTKTTGIASAKPPRSSRMPAKTVPPQTKGEKAPYSSTALRLDVWRNTIEMIKDRPVFGFGLGNHKIAYPLYHRLAVEEKLFSEQSQLSKVHNDYLQTVAELGLVGAGCLVFLFLTLVRTIWRATSQTITGARRFQNIGIAAALTGLMVNAFFSFPFQRAIPPFGFMLLLGLIASSDPRSSIRVIRFLSRKAMAPAVILLSGCLLFLCGFHYRNLAGDAHYLQMTRMEKAKNWQGTITEAQKAYDCAPWRTHTLSYMGRAYVETGRFTEAAEVLEQMAARYPNHINALLNLGVAYGGIGETRKALDVYAHILQIKPDYAKVHNNIADIFVKQKRYQRALDEFKTAAALDPENAAFHFNTGVAAIKLGLYEEAAEALKHSIRQRSDWYKSHMILGSIYIRYLQKPRLGARHLKKAIDLNPNAPEAVQIRRLLENLPPNHG